MLWAGLTGDRHLWFVLTDPDPATSKVVVAMVVTARGHTDKTVTLVSGDHPFIRHESNVDYGSARMVPHDLLEGLVESGDVKLQPEMTTTLLANVRSGLLTSARTIHYISGYCRPLFSGNSPEPGKP